jgi:MFS family permease
MGQATVFAVLPPLGREVNLSELQITALISSSSLCFALTSTYWGRLSDRRGRKSVLLVGLLGYTLGTALFAAMFFLGLRGMLAGIALYSALLVTRCLLAGIMSAIGATCTAYTADISTPAQRTRLLARLASATSLGMILGPIVVGFMALLGLIAPLLLSAILGIVSLTLIGRYLPDLPLAVQPGQPARPKLRFQDPRVRRYITAAAALFVGFAAIQQTLAFRLQDVLNLSGIATAQVTGGALMVSAVMMISAQLGLLQHLRWPHERFVKVGLVCMTTAGVLITSFPALLPIYLGMGFLGAGLGLTMPALAAAVSLAVTPQEQGAVAGMINACPGFGFVLGPTLGGALYQLNGSYAPAFAATVFAVVLLALTINPHPTSGSSTRN